VVSSFHVPQLKVGIATGYGLDDLGVGVPSPSIGKTFLLSTSFRPVLGPTQPSIQRVPGAKRPGREAEVKNTWIYTAHSPIRLHGVVLNLLSSGLKI
jgi:hypothetical protein